MTKISSGLKTLFLVHLVIGLVFRPGIPVHPGVGHGLVGRDPQGRISLPPGGCRHPRFFRQFLVRLPGCRMGTGEDGRAGGDRLDGPGRGWWACMACSSPVSPHPCGSVSSSWLALRARSFISTGRSETGWDRPPRQRVNRIAFTMRRLMNITHRDHYRR